MFRSQTIIGVVAAPIPNNNYCLRSTTNGGIVMVNFYSAFVGDGNVTIDAVVKHINHIADVAGVDHVGIGSDYDGVSSVPEGLEDVSKYPDLFDLLRTDNAERWTIENLEKLAGRNLVRVFQKVEEVRDQLANCLPDESLIDDVIDSPQMICRPSPTRNGGHYYRSVTIFEMLVLCGLMMISM